MRSLLALVILATFASVAVADQASRKRADKLFQDGRKYLANGEYSLACTAFEQSQGVEPAIGTQLNIALCYEKWGRLAAAYSAYLEAERQAREARDKRSTVAKQHAIALEPKLARLRVTIPDGIDRYAIYLLDAAEIEAVKLQTELVLEPGPHVIEVRVAGFPPKKSEITLKAGQKQKLELELPSDPKKATKEDEKKVVEEPQQEDVRVEEPAPQPATMRSKPKLYGGIAMLAGGVVTVGVASYLALDARSDYNAALERCPDSMCPVLADYEATRDAKSRARTMTWVFGGGVAIAAVGTILILTSKRAAPTERISITPVVTGNSAGIAIGGSL